MKRYVLLAASLAACSPGGGNVFPSPSSGKWTMWGGGRAIIATNNGTFSFPTQASNTSVNYVYTVPAANLATAGSITMSYSVDGNGAFGAAANDTPPDTMHLFLWQKGDNLSCEGSYASYRMFAARTLLVFGDNQTISAPLNYSSWTGCYPQSSETGFAALLANPFAMGITFGGSSFAGHGVWMSSGTAKFKVNSFTVR
jgi:hypothetical protein